MQTSVYLILSNLRGFVELAFHLACADAFRRPCFLTDLVSEHFNPFPPEVAFRGLLVKTDDPVLRSLCSPKMDLIKDLCKCQLQVDLRHFNNFKTNGRNEPKM